MSLITHALRELQDVIDDPDLITCYLEIIMAYEAKSAEDIDPDILVELFKRHHVGPITNDPKDWMLEGQGSWRNFRDERIISDDGGRTYFNVTDEEPTRYVSAERKEG